MKLIMDLITNHSWSEIVKIGLFIICWFSVPIVVIELLPFLLKAFMKSGQYYSCSNCGRNIKELEGKPYRTNELICCNCEDSIRATVC